MKEESFTESFLTNYALEGKMLRIYTYPEPILKTVSRPVEHFNDNLRALAKNMLYTMYKASGIGLAASQIGLSLRMFVMDVDYKREESQENKNSVVLNNLNPRIFVNPIFKKKEGQTSYQEGCLSIPSIYEEVSRFNNVCIEYRDLENRLLHIEADGLLSICLQHENDHLDGIVFLERLSKIKKDFLTKKYLKHRNA